MVLKLIGDGYYNLEVFMDFTENPRSYPLVFGSEILTVSQTWEVQNTLRFFRVITLLITFND